MMMRFYVAVIARAAMQRRYFADLADLTELLQNAMHGGQGDMRVCSAHCSVDIFRAGMVLRGNQDADDGEPLRGDRQPALVAALNKVVEPARRVVRSPARIQHSQFSHRQPPLTGCGKTNFFMKNLSAPCDKTGFLPLVLPLWGRLQRGKAGCGRPFSASC